VPDEASVPITLLRCHPGSKSDASASTIREHYMVFNSARWSPLRR
jgi:hypothetical protein